jgi:hypothetical protein
MLPGAAAERAAGPATGPDTPSAPRCADAAELRGDQRYATAAPGLRWLLIEHPGPWPRRAFDTSPVLGRLAERAAAHGIRAVLIRRPGRQPANARVNWAYVDARPGSEGVWWAVADDYEALLDVPLDTPDRPPSPDPVHLVCAHGKHDTCCAVRGRPVAVALEDTFPGTAWECSHVGGDRFAANLVVLPHGLYYGQVDPTTAVEVAREYRRGRVVVGPLRGRSVFSPAVQAAQHHARLALGEFGVDALPPVAVEQLPDADGGVRWRVTLDADGAPVTVVLAVSLSEPAQLTCAALRPQSARVFTLIALDH